MHPHKLPGQEEGGAIPRRPYCRNRVQGLSQSPETSAIEAVWCRCT